MWRLRGRGSGGGIICMPERFGSWDPQSLIYLFFFFFLAVFSGVLSRVRAGWSPWRRPADSSILFAKSPDPLLAWLAWYIRTLFAVLASAITSAIAQPSSHQPSHQPLGSELGQSATSCWPLTATRRNPHVSQLSPFFSGSENWQASRASRDKARWFDVLRRGGRRRNMTHLGVVWPGRSAFPHWGASGVQHPASSIQHLVTAVGHCSFRNVSSGKHVAHKVTSHLCPCPPWLFGTVRRARQMPPDEATNQLALGERRHSRRLSFVHQHRPPSPTAGHQQRRTRPPPTLVVFPFPQPGFPCGALSPGVSLCPGRPCANPGCGVFGISHRRALRLRGSVRS